MADSTLPPLAAADEGSHSLLSTIMHTMGTLVLYILLATVPVALLALVRRRSRLQNHQTHPAHSSMIFGSGVARSVSFGRALSWTPTNSNATESCDWLEALLPFLFQHVDFKDHSRLLLGINLVLRNCAEVTVRSMSLQSLQLGTVLPHISAIQVAADSSSGGQSISFDVHYQVTPVDAPKKGLCAVISDEWKVPNLDPFRSSVMFQVLNFEGRFMIQLPKLVGPHVAASLIREPSFTIAVVNPVTRQPTPNLEEAVRERLSLALLNTFMTPHSEQIPIALFPEMLDGGDSNSISSHKSILSRDYILHLRVMHANNLAAKDSNGFSDPYCVLRLDDGPETRTKIVKRTLNPKWDHDCDFVLNRTSRVLKITLYDHDRFASADFLGLVEINLVSLPKDRPLYERKFPVMPRAGHRDQVSGSITLSFLFEPLQSHTESTRAASITNLPTVTSNLGQESSFLTISTPQVNSQPGAPTFAIEHSPSASTITPTGDLLHPQTPGQSSTQDIRLQPNASAPAIVPDHAAARQHAVQKVPSMKISPSTSQRDDDNMSDNMSVATNATDMPQSGNGPRSQLVLEVGSGSNVKHYLIDSEEAKLPAEIAKQKTHKLHIFSGHTFVATHFSKKEPCEVCRVIISGLLGKQGYQCRDCMMVVHKKCHTRVSLACTQADSTRLNIVKPKYLM